MSKLIGKLIFATIISQIINFLLGFYLLNILDANIGAHLLQFNVNENLSISPKIDENIYNSPNLSFSLNINFNKKWK